MSGPRPPPPATSSRLPPSAPVSLILRYASRNSRTDFPPLGIPTVIYSTYTVAPTSVGASSGLPSSPTVPSYTSSPSPITGAASGLKASFGLAAFAAVAALFM